MAACFYVQITTKKYVSHYNAKIQVINEEWGNAIMFGFFIP